MRQTAPYLASYLAPWIIQRLHDDPRPPTKPSLDDVAAAVLFVDVSGFTPLAERLGEQGVVGAEHLSRALNAYFAPAIDVIAEDGGQVVDFAGDALIAAWFAVEGGEPLAACVRRAACSALRLRDRLNDHEVAAGIRLAMKAGLGAGTVRVCSVGGAEGRWRFLMAGTPVR
jgi:class 3 adenylate cyclase